MKNLVSEERPVDELAAGSECASKEFMAVKMFIASVFSFSLPLSMLRGSSRGKGGNGMYPYLNCCTGCHLTGSLQGEQQRKEACHFE